jgi:CDGSH-type Zn-finger protein/uncharacterized Fe-S cluster protein YjdI
MRKTREYESEEIRVRYDVARCIHAEECTHGLPAVFDRYRRPWVDPVLASADQVAAVVGRCPTGALTHERLDGGQQEKAPAGNRLTVAANGPVYAHADLEIRDDAGRVITREFRVAFCRCGASEHKPYCDGSHTEIAFQAEGGIGPALVKKPGADDSPRLGVRLLANGPLLLEGAFTLRAGEGEASVEGSGGALCRCGASAAKPFCDGTHKQIDFRAQDPVSEEV